MKTKLRPLLVSLLIAAPALSAHADLVSRAGGTMVYDTVLDITWVADANLFKTQAAANPGLVASIIANIGTVATDFGPVALSADDFDTATGKMTWWGAQAWAANLSFGGHEDWRLPSHPCDGNAMACATYGTDHPESEMGHLFYVGLGGQSFQAISAQHNASYDLFVNVMDWKYASGTQGHFPFNPAGAYQTSFSNGDQYITWQYLRDSHAWAVADGDIGAAPVPEAGTWAMLLAGLGLLGTVARRRKA